MIGTDTHAQVTAHSCIPTWPANPYQVCDPAWQEPSPCWPSAAAASASELGALTPPVAAAAARQALETPPVMLEPTSYWTNPANRRGTRM